MKKLSESIFDIEGDTKDPIFRLDRSNISENPYYNSEFVDGGNLSIGHLSSDKQCVFPLAKSAYFDRTPLTGPESVHGLFYGCRNLKDVEFRDMDFGKALFFISTFDDCRSLEKIEFNNCSNIRPKFLNMMFSQCRSLEHIDLSDFNFDRSETAAWMFGGCMNLRSIDFGKSVWKKTPSIFMIHMFEFCVKLERLDLSNIIGNKIKNRSDFKSGRNISYMFRCCDNLKSIKGIFNINANIVRSSDMFESCDELEEVYLHVFPCNKNISKSGDLRINSLYLCDILPKISEESLKFLAENIVPAGMLSGQNIVLSESQSRTHSDPKFYDWMKSELLKKNWNLIVQKL